MAELKQGCTLKSGKYKIVKTLGQGSFGITYLAKTRISMDGQLGKMDVNVNVTIKEFFMSDLNSRSSDGTNVERTNSTLVKNYLNKFRREAENLAKLHHPNIVKVLEVFDENNTTYYVMEYVDGETIDEYIKSKGHLSEGESLKITQDVCAALSYMHEHKMLHLDLKPKNIMRNSEGHIYLIDFGLAKQYKENGEPESSTSIGLGTPGYAPLEQANYKQDGTLPVTLDVYALGASLFKMLTGKTPPEASTILNEGFPLTSLQKAGISSDTISIVEKAMASVKKDRYQSVNVLSKAIVNISSDDEQTNIPQKEDVTIYDEEINNTNVDSHIEKFYIENVVRSIGKRKIVMSVGLGIIITLLLCTISNIPLEIRHLIGYYTDEAENQIIIKWNFGIIILCVSILCLVFYILSKRKILAYISSIGIVASLGFLFYFVEATHRSYERGREELERMIKTNDPDMPNTTFRENDTLPLEELPCE